MEGGFPMSVPVSCIPNVPIPWNSPKPGSYTALLRARGGRGAEDMTPQSKHFGRFRNLQSCLQYLTVGLCLKMTKSCLL